MTTPPRGFIATVRVSPDGTRLAVSVLDGQKTAIRIIDAADGHRVAEVTLAGGPVFDASFVDDHRLVFLGVGQSSFQAYLHDVETRSTAPLSQAPYLAFRPVAARGTVRFLNREGWRWTLDEVRLPPPARDAGSASAENLIAMVPRDRSYASWPPTLGPPVAATPIVVRESEASAFDHLFVPQLHGAFFSSTGDVSTYSLGLSGGDRLGRHRWSVYGLWSPGTDPGGGLAYANSQLAPFVIHAAASSVSTLRTREPAPGSEIKPPDIERHSREASLALSRSFRTTAAALQFLALEDIWPEDTLLHPQHRRMGGPALSLVHGAAEQTPYGGIRRSLALGLSGAVYRIRCMHRRLAGAD